MEPETSLPKLGPEQAPVSPDSHVERGPSLPTPEVGIERSAERHEQVAEASAQAADSAGVTPVVPLPVTPDPLADDVSTTLTDSPLVANDDDLIEKEWVDKAKKIINSTKEDPYKREEAVSQLQKDYLKKRYGKELGASE